MMIPRRGTFLTAAMLIAALVALPGGGALAANKPPKPAPMLGSHPTKEAKSARLALLKQRSSTVTPKALHPPKTANSLIHRPGKTITVPRKPIK